MSSWHEEARRMHAAGASPREICKKFGKSATSVRCAIDENYRQKQLDSTRRQKARERTRLRQREEIKGVRVRIELPAEPIDRLVQRAYAEKPARRPLTLPQISFPALPEEPAVRKFAPRTRVTVSPGAERWREIHRQMIRRGKVETADIGWMR